MASVLEGVTGEELLLLAATRGRIAFDVIDAELSRRARLARRARLRRQEKTAMPVRKSDVPATPLSPAA